MLQLKQTLESELFNKLVREKSLPHPTARNFDLAKWQEAYDALNARSPRDESLAAAAVHYGTELESLRKTFDDKILAGMSRSEAKIFGVAFANREFWVLLDKVRKDVKKKTVGKVVRLDRSGVLVSNPLSGNDLSPDSLSATIVDTLPHCIERAQRLPSKDSAIPIELNGDHMKLYSVLSIEHSIRDLWQSVLWKGALLTSNDNQLKQVPADKALIEHELAWTRRIEGIATQGAMLDEVTETQLIKVGKETPPYLNKTVTGIGAGAGGRSFKFGAQNGRAGQQWRHRSQMTALQESYLADFLDAPLPSTGKHQLTCRELHNVWCVLVDAAAVLNTKKKVKDLTGFDSARRFSLLMRTSELERAAMECAGISPERAAEAIKFLSLDGTDTGAMFAEGFWSRPILAVNDTESALVATSLFVGNPIRRVELWMTRGGFADNLSNARRGIAFEAHVRAELVAAVEKNDLFSDSYCSDIGIKAAAPDGEQIDLLFRIRDLVVVGEVKCLLAPVEPTEQANYLKKITEACSQAARKAAWLKARRDVLASAVDLSKERADNATVLPIVVTNQSFGASLVVGDCRVIDSHFLRLYLKSGRYVAGAAFRRDEGDAVLQHEILYKSEQEAEQKFVPSIENPSPLNKYLKIVRWTEARFPLSTGENLLIENCVLEGNLNPIGDQEIHELFG